MRKEIDVEVDPSSWLKSTVPTNLYKLNGRQTVNILHILIHIALRTRPPISAGFSLGDTWALLRYYPAIISSQDLRLVEEWEDTDSHQKTILSDDFGVGFASYFLTQALDLIAIIPTNYLLKVYPSLRLKPSGGKRGPKKSPDYIGIDRNYKMHVFECKGTQNNIRSLENQIVKGKVQKNNIDDPCNIIDQSLVVGLFIPQYNSADSALLRIEDPEPSLDFSRIDKKELAKFIIIGEIATYLQMLGFHNLANTFARNTIIDKGFKENIKKEINRLETFEINQKEYKCRKILYRFNQYSNQFVENTYGVEIIVGIEGAVVDRIIYQNLDTPFLKDIKDFVEDAPFWQLYEGEEKVSITSPLGLLVEMEIKRSNAIYFE